MGRVYREGQGNRGWEGPKGLVGSEPHWPVFSEVLTWARPHTELVTENITSLWAHTALSGCGVRKQTQVK